MAVNGVVSDDAVRDKVLQTIRSVAAAAIVKDLIIVTGSTSLNAEPPATLGIARTAESFYEILEVSRSAGQQTIDAAYEALTRVYSARAAMGDANADNQLKFLRTAYEVVSDPKKRALYDQQHRASSAAR